MAMYSTNEFKSGLKLMIDGDPCAIIENEFVKPGKGQAFNRVKLRNLKTGRVLEKTYKSGESVEGADVVDVTMQYLYNDGEMWHFMDPSHPLHQAPGSDRYRDAILDYYRYMDRQIADLLAELDEQTVLVLMSDHGAGPFHKYIYMNNWLLRWGLLQLFHLR